MRAATEGNLPPVLPRGNLVEVPGREVRQGLPGDLMVESSPSRQRWPPCKTTKGMSDEAADAAALTHSLTLTFCPVGTQVVARHLQSSTRPTTATSMPTKGHTTPPHHCSWSANPIWF